MRSPSFVLALACFVGGASACPPGYQQQYVPQYAPQYAGNYQYQPQYYPPPQFQPYYAPQYQPSGFELDFQRRGILGYPRETLRLRNNGSGAAPFGYGGGRPFVTDGY